MNHKIFPTIGDIGLLLILVGAAMPIFYANPYISDVDIARYVFAAGAGINLIGRLFTRYDGDNLRIRRLYSTQVFAALAFVAASFFTFYRQSQSTDWLAFTIAGTFLHLYSFYRIRYLERNGKK